MSVNDLIMLVLFAPIVGLLVAGASSLTVPFDIAAPGALIGASNFFELGVATASTGPPAGPGPRAPRAFAELVRVIVRDFE